ncbi:MAG: polysaccharide deacetylase family protein [Actinomycetota bacterium]|nr:polysaccharide deacetylase family protein [Actinomycetota bacterium]
MTVALTFDDGPDPVWTPRLLDRLARLRARATFFPIAPRAAAQPELIARMLEEGHAIGLHCDEHVRHGTRDIEWGRRDTARALERLSALGVAAALWRPPWGDLAPWSEVVAHEFGLRIVGWTVDTHDWRGDTAADMFTASRGSLCPRAIVLAHDGIGPGARRADVEQTLDFVTLAANHTRRRGLELEALA